LAHGQWWPAADRMNACSECFSADIEPGHRIGGPTLSLAIACRAHGLRYGWMVWAGSVIIGGFGHMWKSPVEDTHFAKQPHVNVTQWSGRRIALATTLVAGLVLGAALVYWCAYALVVAFVALLLATPLQPLLRPLQRLGAPRSLAVVVVHVSVVATLLLCVLALLPLAWQQGSEFLASLPDQYEQFQSWLSQVDSRAIRRMAELLPDPMRWEFEPASVEFSRIFSDAWQVITAVSWQLFVLIACLLASIYWSIESPRLVQSAKMLLPVERRDAATDLFLTVEQKLGAYVRGQAILCVLVGGMAWSAYWWIGLPYAAVLALIAGICEAVPVIGPIVGALPALLVGLSIRPQVALWVVVANIVIASIESYLLVPRIMNREVGVHPIVTLLSITALFALLGPLGGILAVPLAAMIQMVFQRWVFPPFDLSQKLDTPERDRIAVLEYHTQQLLDELYGQMTRRHPAASAAEIESIEEDLELMLRRFSELLRQSRATEAG
jgi:predicted PurR-regulated permease PerM